MQQPILAILGVANDNFAEACGLTLTLNGVPVEVQPDGQWMSTLLLDEGQMIMITAIATDGAGNSASHQISASYIRYPGPLLMVPMFLSVDPDGNGVFEVSDQVAKVKPHWANILGMPHNVTGFIGTGTDPVPINEDEVEIILKRMGVEEPKYKIDLAPGDPVRINDGPFKDMDAVVSDIDQEKGKIKVLVSIFGRETPVEVDFLQVKKI